MAPQVLLIFRRRADESAEMLKGILQHQRANGSWSVFLHDEPQPGIDPCCWLRSRRWNGVISREATKELFQACARLRLPVVDLADATPVFGAAKVRPDNHEIGRLGGTHLLERSFPHYGYCGYANQDWSVERRNGFCAALGRARQRCEIFEVERPAELTPTWDARQTALLAAWLQCLPAGMAVMACDDQRAQQVARAARTAGKQVPQEVAILGVNNDAVRCELTDPPLSSIALNALESGRRAAEQLGYMMAGGETDPVDLRILPLGVVTRKSTDVLGLRDKDVAAALTYIREHACEGIKVEHVLKKVAISRSHLEHKLRRYIGRSPQVEIRRVQIASACELLTDTNWTLKAIAQQTGFEHVEYFSVVFKRLTGETPGRFRCKNAVSPEYPRASV